jgi:hypothetical protein
LTQIQAVEGEIKSQEPLQTGLAEGAKTTDQNRKNQGMACRRRLIPSRARKE